MLARNGRLACIEVKKPGNKPTPVQLAYMVKLSTYGVPCAVCFDAVGAEAFLSSIS